MVYTNRTTDQEPVAFDLPVPETPAPTKEQALNEATHLGDQGSLFQYRSDGAEPSTASEDVAGGTHPLDEVRQSPAVVARGLRKELKTREEVIVALKQHGLSVYPRKPGLVKLGRSLKTEEKPELDDMSEISRAVAARLPLDTGNLRATAVKVDRKSVV